MTDSATLTAAADLLRAGHDLMMERGRCPRGASDTRGRYCMGEALYEAAGVAEFDRWGTHGEDYEPELTTAMGALAEAIEPGWLTKRPEVRDPDGVVVNFNDDPATTDDACFDTYVRAEKALREQAAR